MDWAQSVSAEPHRPSPLFHSNSLPFCVSCAFLRLINLPFQPMRHLTRYLNQSQGKKETIDVNTQLLLENIRNVLIRLEDSIIFALLERAQFKLNPTVYERGAFGAATAEESLVGYLLHETEKIHAKMRRFTSPDEKPFFTDLPAPILPVLHFDENPLRPNTVNFCAQIRRIYEHNLLPLICEPGDDAQYGSSAVADVICLQTLAKRIHYGMFVAESKYQERPETYRNLIEAGDRHALMAAITDAAVEQKVLDRVLLKARTYGQTPGDVSSQKVAPSTIVSLYRDWIIPLTKDVQVEYLLPPRSASWS